MKVTTSSFINVDISPLVLADPMLAAEMPKRGSNMLLPWPSLKFTRLMELCGQLEDVYRAQLDAELYPPYREALKRLQRLTVSCRFEPEESELDDVLWYAMLPDASCARTKADLRWLEEAWKALPFLPESRNVRRFEEYRITKLPSRKNKIVSPDGGFFFVPDDIVAQFEQQGFTGVEWGSLLNRKGTELHMGFKLLIARNLIGPVDRNAAMEFSTDGNGYDFLLPHAGVRCLSPSALRMALDVNLTADPVAGYNLGATVVSRRVKEFLSPIPSKGVYFEPVIETGTTLYQKFLSQWADFVSEVKRHHDNRIN
jgi:hypothetical protein